MSDLINLIKERSKHEALELKNVVTNKEMIRGAGPGFG